MSTSPLHRQLIHHVCAASNRGTSPLNATSQGADLAAGLADIHTIADLAMLRRRLRQSRSTQHGTTAGVVSTPGKASNRPRRLPCNVTRVRTCCSWPEQPQHRYRPPASGIDTHRYREAHWAHAVGAGVEGACAAIPAPPCGQSSPVPSVIHTHTHTHPRRFSQHSQTGPASRSQCAIPRRRCVGRGVWVGLCGSGRGSYNIQAPRTRA
ncbi:hypothetical protein EDC01DRAFT_305356 [Geopyxis carbonaria]|nr:hypothetical protein EDC01DRAFT_305356 [Geopyxis carbonaria]